MAYKAIFLDRDDTLIEDPGYISDPGQVELMPGASKALIDLKKMGYKTIVVSNQSGVARGIVTEKTLDHIHARLRELLGRQNAYLDAIYYCPYHPEGSVQKYRKDSDMRKPNPGMLLKAATDLDIDLENSWMVGDSYRDTTAGKKAGCRTILINSPVKPAHKGKEDREPDHKAVNIIEAVNIIKMFDRQSHVSVESVRAKVDAGMRNMPVETEMPDDLQKEKQQATEEKVETQKKAIQEKSENDAQQKIEPPKETRIEPAQNKEVTELDKVTEEIEAIKEFAESAISHEKPHKEKHQHLESLHHSAAYEKTHRLLEDIHSTLNKLQRQAMFSEFSALRVLAWTMQIVACGLLILSLIFLLDNEKSMSSVYITLAYAVFIQLMAVAFCFMEGRK